MLVHDLLTGSAAETPLTYSYVFAQRMLASFALVEGSLIGTWFALSHSASKPLPADHAHASERSPKIRQPGIAP